MQLSMLISTLALVSTSMALTSPVTTTPQAAPTATFTPGQPQTFATGLEKRDGNCASGYSSCSELGAPGICCASSQVCGADEAGNVACCPVGAFCVGSISSVIGAATTGQYAPDGLVTASGTVDGVLVVGTSTSSLAGAAGRVELPLLIQGVIGVLDFLV